MRTMRWLTILAVTVLAAITPASAQAGVGGGSGICVPWTWGDPVTYWSWQEFIAAKHQELRWITVTNPCTSVAVVDIYHNKPPNLKLTRIVFFPGPTVTVTEAQMKAAGIKTRNVTGSGGGMGPATDPCGIDAAGGKVYVADAAGNVTPRVC
jgi:hypothetical protein